MLLHTLSMLMQVLGVNTQFCMGGYFGKEGPILAAKTGPGTTFSAKISPPD